MTFAGRKSYVLRPLMAADPDALIVAADADPDAPVRATAKRFETVPPVARPEAYIDALLEICRRDQIDAVLVTNDRDVELLTEARVRFGEVGTRVLGAPAELTRAMCDKWAAFQWFEAHGYPTVSTWKVDTLPEDISFPVIVKPRRGQGSRGVRRCNEPDDLIGLGDDVIVQPWLEGVHYDIDVLRAADGTVCHVIPKVKLEMADGTASKVRSIGSGELTALGERLANDLDFVGAFDVDIIERDGTPMVLEVNPRLGGCFPYSCRFAPEFPGALLEVARGETPSIRTGTHRVGVTVARELDFVELEASSESSAPAVRTATKPQPSQRDTTREHWRIAIQCYNEEHSLEATVVDIDAMADLVPEMEVEIVMIDDGSTDGTRAVMHQLEERFPRCVTRVNPRNMGPGGSVVALWAETDPDWWFTALPGDNEIVAQSMLNHARVRRDNDIIIGYLQNPIIRPMRRRIASFVFNQFVQWTYAFPFRYMNGPKLYRVRAFQGIEVVGGGHAFNAELMAKALLRKPDLRIEEVPFVARGRAAGSSKAFTPRNILKAAREFYQGYMSVRGYRERVIKG